MRWLEAALLSLLLCGCATEPTTEAPELPLPDALERAAELRDLGRFSEALGLLTRAMPADPADPGLERMRESINSAWRRVRRQTEDRQVVVAAEGLLQQIPLQITLVRGDVDDAAARAALDDLRRGLRAQLPQLTRCGRRQAEQDSRLARRCLATALAIREQADDRALFEQLAPEEDPLSATAPRATPAPEPLPAPGEAVKHAEALLERGELIAARRLLDAHLLRAPDDTAAGELRRRLGERLTGYVRTLIEAGDALYREAEVEGAIRVWRAALDLDPRDPRAEAKLKRAETVLSNLNRLREQPPDSPMPTATEPR